MRPMKGLSKGNIHFSLFFLILVSLLILNSCNSKARDTKLQEEVTALVQNFHGQAGIYVADAEGKVLAEFNADTVFPTASMIKLPILCTLWGKIFAGTLNPDSLVRFYADSLHYPWKGEDALARFRPGEDISIRQLMTHMITFSDNHASLYLQDLAGSGKAINEWLAAEGFIATRVNSRTPGRDSDYRQFGWGQTTPREMASLLLRIRDGEVISPAVSEAVYRHLTRIYWNGEALSQIPPGIQAATKQGAVDNSRSEVVLVNAPHGDYVFCVITKNQADTSWTKSNEGWVLIRKVSAMLWNHFEPGLPYQSPQEMERYLP